MEKKESLKERCLQTKKSYQESMNQVGAFHLQMAVKYMVAVAQGKSITMVAKHLKTL